MFKLFFAQKGAGTARPRRLHSMFDVPSSFILPLCTLLLILLFLAGCALLPPLPQANLRDPGWTVREGQAVWKSKRGASDIAGEILVATQPDGRAFVQFTKTPF